METLVRIVVFSATSATFLRNIANFPLRNWDEAWYAEIIKNMASGQYSLLVPFWNNEYFFDKPPLYFWLSLPFFEIFGSGEWQARIVSAISAVLATFLVYLVGRRLFGSRVAVLAVFVFLTLGQVVIRFAHGNLDALVVCLVLATVYFYMTLGKFWFVAGITLALVYLSKGWILGLLPIVTLLLFEVFWLGRNFKKAFFVVCFSIILVSPYYILGYLKFGQEFISWYLANPTASLFSLEVFSLEFFTNLARDVGFWLAPLCLSLAVAFKVKREDMLKLFVLAFSGLIFLFSISFLSGKLGWYALPVYPFIAIMLAYFIERLFARKFVLAVILVVLALGLQTYNVKRIENIHPDRSKIGATLGKVAFGLVPKDDILILDERDLTSFLFYSNHQTAFVLSDNRRDWEWWIYKYEDLPNLLGQQKNVWVVTRNPNRFDNFWVETEVEGYKFLKYTF